ncbi:MAG: hypothetical protein ABIH82_03360 [Candidatus Woesearchaeota archaeon]
MANYISRILNKVGLTGRRAYERPPLDEHQQTEGLENRTSNVYYLRPPDVSDSTQNNEDKYTSGNRSQS